MPETSDPSSPAPPSELPGAKGHAPPPPAPPTAEAVQSGAASAAPGQPGGAGEDKDNVGPEVPPANPSGTPQSSGSLEPALIFLLPAALVVLGVLLYYVIENLGLVPTSYDLELKLALVAVLGYLAIRFVGAIVGSAAHRWAGLHGAGLLVSVYRLVAYTALILALLLVAGVNSLSLLAGGTFAGLVLGLAGQTVLSNVIAGVFLLFVRPFEPGDRITVTTWQYGLIAPIYPPKFYSQDTLIPGYTGVVKDIGIAYTSMELDDATTFRVPNSILIQAGVVSHEVEQRWVRLKYEVPPAVDPEVLIPRLARAVRSNRWVSDPSSVRVMVNQATMSSYVIAIDALCRGNQEEGPRSALLVMSMKLVKELSAGPTAVRPARP